MQVGQATPPQNASDRASGNLFNLLVLVDLDSLL